MDTDSSLTDDRSRQGVSVHADDHGDFSTHASFGSDPARDARPRRGAVPPPRFRAALHYYQIAPRFDDGLAELEASGPAAGAAKHPAAARLLGRKTHPLEQPRTDRTRRVALDRQ